MDISQRANKEAIQAIEGTSLATVLSDTRYIRQRTRPCLFDMDYIQLTDLNALLQSSAKSYHGDIFDYGCGGAPYRELFINCRSYTAADITPGPRVDRLLSEDGLTQESSGKFDFVLSTQVLEHVKDPNGYLLECARILRPGGQLLLTTHGMIQEHGCPYDFQRWTCRGLEELVKECGFRIIDSGKTTTEVRAVIQLMHQLVLHLRSDGRPLIHYPLAMLRKIYGMLLLPALNKFADLFPHNSVEPGTGNASLYVGVYVRAEKEQA